MNLQEVKSFVHNYFQRYLKNKFEEPFKHQLHPILQVWISDWANLLCIVCASCPVTCSFPHNYFRRYLNTFFFFFGGERHTIYNLSTDCICKFCLSWSFVHHSFLNVLEVGRSWIITIENISKSNYIGWEVETVT